MDYKVRDLITDYSNKQRGFLVNKVRYLQNHSSPQDLIKLLNNKIINDEKLFDQIFFNRICREYDVIKYIIANKLDFSEKQIEWISKTKFIQNSASERTLFLKSYSKKDFKQKRLSINKLAKKVRLENISINNKEIYRTMKIGVDYDLMDEQSQEWLNIYLKEYEEAKIELYKDLYTLFTVNPIKLLMIASQPNRAENHNLVEKELYKVNNQQIKIKISDGLEFDVYKISYQTNNKTKEEYIAYINGEKNLPVKLTKDNESDVFSITKFDAQSLANNLSSKYFSLQLKGDKATDSFFNGIKFSDFSKNIKSTIVAEALRTKIAQTVCSFLDKYYDAITQVEKIYEQNKKTFETNNKFKDLSHLFDYPINLPKTEVADVYKYNSFVTSYNQHINEFIWQVSDDNNIEDKVKKLNVIKGVPSFPLIEKETTKDYKKILEDIVKTFENLKSDYQKLDWNKVDTEKLSSWLTRKSARSGRLITAFFKSLKKENVFKEIEYKQIAIPREASVKVMRDLVAYVYQRIDKIKDIDFKDHSKVRDFADMYAQYISLVSELVFDKKTKEYTDFRIKFNTDTALLKANPFEGQRQIKNEIYFTGFSSKSDTLKKGFSLVFKEVEGKLRFYIIFNLKNLINLKLTDIKSEFKAITWEGADEKQVPVIKYLHFKDIEGTCILPISFGRRLAQRYFYDSSFNKSEFNQLNSIIKGLVKFSDLRIIKETNNKRDVFYCAISLSKRFPIAKSEYYEYKSIIGIDMGEKIPAVIAKIRLNNQIESYKFLHPEMNSKLVEIQSEKDESQKNKGYVSPKLTNKIKNITKVLLEDIAIESLSECVDSKSLLVTEDLGRGFGRGSIKGTYVWMRQYTKVNDILFEKSKELGLVNGKKQPINFKSDGILAKVPAGYTSKTSIQTGFILRSPKSMVFKDDNIAKLQKLTLLDNLLNVNFELDLVGKEIMVKWNNLSTTIKFNGKASELGRFYGSELGKEKFEKLINTVFNDTSKSSIERKGAIKSFIYNLLNPRKTQETYTDIFTKKSVNADVQGAVNIARSYLFGLSKYYKPGLGSDQRLRKWQDWYRENLTEIPDSIYIQ